MTQRLRCSDLSRTRGVGNDDEDSGTARDTGSLRVRIREDVEEYRVGESYDRN